MSYRPPTNSLMAAMAAQMAAQSYHMPGLQPMGGLIPMQMMPPMPPTPMGVTVPSGVTTISAPPVRNIQTMDGSLGLPGGQQSAPPSLLGVYPGAANAIFQQMAAANQDTQQQYRKPKPAPGSTITVFVGNITERASDMLIRQLLSKCGAVNNWKRVQGANGKLQAFGFCEYCDQESALRAVRLLLDFEIADKKLVVKVDPKTQEKLDEYLKSKGITGTQIDEQTKEEDKIYVTQLQTVLKEHEIELAKEPDSKERQRRYQNDKRDPTKPENLSEMDLEDDKRSLIHREIDKFRDTYKKIEEKKEEEKKRKDEDKIGDKDDIKRDRRSRERSRDRSVERDRDRNNTRRRDRDSDRDRRDRERESREQRDREREQRDRERERDRYRERDRERRSEVKDTTPVEDEEEAYERRRLERQMKEKEASYQRRLREWEQREIRKSKDYDKDRQKEERRQLEHEDEKRKLKIFLEDYIDDKMDAEYYKGNEFLRRKRHREKEIQADENERLQEKKELEELREKLSLEGHPDPDSEVRKRMQASADSERNSRVVSDRIRALMLEARQKSGSVRIGDSDDLSLGSDITPKEEVPVKTFGFAGMKLQNTSINTTNNSNTIVNNGTDRGTANQPSNGNTPDSVDMTTNGGPAVSATGTDLKRKKLSVSDVFNSNEDDDNAKAKKRKLPTLVDDNTDSNLSTPTAAKTAIGSDNKTLTSEEKRKQIKALIEKIPTVREELFKYEIDWSLVDNTLMERRIRPWINKKISEYIGEEELALLDFICNKLQSKSSAQSILDDVAMVLDEEAEVFVVKMWRLLIYEIEAKKLGLGK